MFGSEHSNRVMSHLKGLKGLIGAISSSEPPSCESSCANWLSFCIRDTGGLWLKETTGVGSEGAREGGEVGGENEPLVQSHSTDAPCGGLSPLSLPLLCRLLRA